MRRLAVCVLLLAACSDNPDTATTTTERVTTTENPRYALSVTDWAGEPRTPGEEAFAAATSLTFGIGTNPDKMLEFGYDLCEMFDDQPQADAIAAWATENNRPAGVASELGDAARDHLC